MLVFSLWSTANGISRQTPPFYILGKIFVNCNSFFPRFVIITYPVCCHCCEEVHLCAWPEQVDLLCVYLVALETWHFTGSNHGVNDNHFYCIATLGPFKINYSRLLLFYSCIGYWMNNLAEMSRQYVNF